jgi:hypothetical protein
MDYERDTHRKSLAKYDNQTAKQNRKAFERIALQLLMNYASHPYFMRNSLVFRSRKQTEADAPTRAHPHLMVLLYL